MSRSAMAGLHMSTLLIVILLLGAAVGWNAPDGTKTGRNVHGSSYFHSGKTVSSDHPDPSCQSDACHAPFPHGNSPTASAFLNMHVRFIECLSCHGVDSRNRWVLMASAAARPGAAGPRTEIAYSVPKGQSENTGRHALLDSPISCRECHSESGTAALRSRGIGNLPAGFANPISLRMMEEGAKRWIPADIR